MKTIEQQVEEKYPKEREEFKKMWNDGEFQWNYPPTFGASREASREVSLWRVWNTFIVPKLEERDRIAREEVIKGEIEYWKGVFDKRPTDRDLESDGIAQNFARIEIERLEKALTTPPKKNLPTRPAGYKPEDDYDID